MTKGPQMSSSLLFPSAPAGPSSLGPVVISTRQVRRLFDRRRRHQRRERRGIILIFVVVLLMLLAIMGTAYLASSRADRLALKGNGAIAGTTTPRLVDRKKLDQLFEAGQDRVKMALIEDLFNVPAGKLPALIRSAESTSTNVSLTAKADLYSKFRQEQLPYSATDATRYYKNYDAPGRADPYLASLMPAKVTTPANTTYRWPYISAPLPGELDTGIEIAPFFADPRQLNRSSTQALYPGFVTGYAAQAPPNTPATDAAYYPNDVNQRSNIQISSLSMLRSDTNDLTVEASKTTRVYPSFLLGGADRIGGDADGDGIVDCGLAPIVLRPTASGVERYLDVANGVFYMIGYRVVDNSSQININTALTQAGDFGDFANSTGTGATSFRTRIQPATGNADALATVTPDSANVGFFRSNVGLIELVKNSLAYLPTGTAPAPQTSEMYRLFDTRFPLLKDTANVPLETRYLVLDDNPMRANTTPAPAPVQVRVDFNEGTRDATGAAVPLLYQHFEYLTLGDLLEQQIARRTLSVGPLHFLSTAAGSTRELKQGALLSLTSSDAISFANRGGALLSAKSTRGDGENALLLSSVMATPNFSGSTNDPWQWYPPGSFDVWYEWSHGFGSTPPQTPGTFSGANDYKVDLLDNPTASARNYTFTAPGNSGYATTPLPRSIRPLLTSYSGVTNVAPQRFDNSTTATTGVPLGMAGYGTDEALPPNATTFASKIPEYPAVRVAAATAPKEALWRAFWSVMTQNQALSGSKSWTPERDLFPTGSTSQVAYTAGNTYDCFLPPDRHPSLVPVDRNVTPYPPGSLTPIERLTERQMVLIRSAIAACNTIDLRDNDDDITAMTIDLDDTSHYEPPASGASSPPSGPRDALFARVYGTERQLVISGMVIDDIDGVGTTAPLVLVELYNPSDRPINLDGYHLNIVQRNVAPVSTGTVTVATGLVDTPAATISLPDSRVSPDAAGVPSLLAPGGFVIISSEPLPPGTPGTQTPIPTRPGIFVEAENKTYVAPPTTPPTADPLAGSPPSQVIYRVAPTLINLQSGAAQQDRELQLLRTRRADGVPYTEDANLLGTEAVPHRPAFSESVASVPDLLSLVPVDAVDTRTLSYTTTDPANPTAPQPPGPSRYFYMRNTVAPNRFTPKAYAWKCFYAGQFFDNRPGRVSAVTPPPTPPAARANATQTNAQSTATSPNVASARTPWRSYPDYGVLTVPDGHFGIYRDPAHWTLTNPILAAEATPLPAPNPTPTAFQAPTIPIQNATPYSTYGTGVAPALGDVDYAPNRYPYGSPFARNGDLLSIPFIGSYKIYRVNVTGVRPTLTINAAPAPALYEYVPVTMDAVNVAPDTNETVLNPSVGRFDARSNLTPKNDWAADLFDYVAARQASGQTLAFPDVPSLYYDVADARTTFNNPLIPATDQDGPVHGTEALANPAPGTRWIQYKQDNGGNVIVANGRKAGKVSIGADTSSQLIAGTINVNSAPPVVLRMLPWTVDPTNGYLRQDPTNFTVLNTEMRQRVSEIDQRLNADTATPTAGWTHASPANNAKPYGFDTLFKLSEIDRLQKTEPTYTTGAFTDRQQMMKYGLLNPQYRPLDPHLDFNVANLNMTRVSNLTSQRSDVFTVYVTVQAWTWVGDSPGSGSPGAKQLAGTRLVGERRGSFIVDRSRISQDHFKPSDLIVYPVDQE